MHRKTCWVCFASEEDDRTVTWVQPCRCRGTTKWVHQMCLQRWIDEKQRGNSTAKVSCPQCGTPYTIEFPPFGKFCNSFNFSIILLLVNLLKVSILNNIANIS